MPDIIVSLTQCLLPRSNLSLTILLICHLNKRAYMGNGYITRFSGPIPHRGESGHIGITVAMNGTKATTVYYQTKPFFRNTVSEKYKICL